MSWACQPIPPGTIRTRSRLSSSRNMSPLLRLLRNPPRKNIPLPRCSSLALLPPMCKLLQRQSQSLKQRTPPPLGRINSSPRRTLLQIITPQCDESRVRSLLATIRIGRQALYHRNKLTGEHLTGSTSVRYAAVNWTLLQATHPRAGVAFAIPDANFDLVFTRPDSQDLLRRLSSAAHGRKKKVKLSIGGWTGSA